MQFKAFKPQAMNKIAQAMGYQGDMGQFQQYIEQDPARQQQMNMYTNAAQKMARGGAVKKYAHGGFHATTSNFPAQIGIGINPPQKTPQPILNPNPNPSIGDTTVQRMYQPGVPVGGVTVAAPTATDASQEVAQGTGTLTGSVAVPTAQAITAQATGPTTTAANVMQAAQAAPAVDAAMQATQAAQANPADPRAQVTAAQQTASSVGNLQAAQGNASLINSPVQRQIQSGELISGVADAAVAANFTEQIQAAQTTPTQAAMVQGQLDGLMQQFVGGNTPAWAAGAIRNANAAMAARGLGASSIAGQAIVQAAMESALPIAQADAQIQAQFEGQNLSNRQQIAMNSAQQRAKFMAWSLTKHFSLVYKTLHVLAI